MKFKLFVIAILCFCAYVQWFHKPIEKRITIPLSTSHYTIFSTTDYNTSSEQREIICIALATFGEIGNVAKHDNDILAVVNVIQNRINHPMFRRPNDSCEVVLQPGQFEPLARNVQLKYAILQTTKGMITVPKMFDAKRWKRVYNIAKMAYNGYLPDITEGSIGFYAPRTQFLLNRSAPYWTKKLRYVATYGGQRFYREYM